ncbi:Rieske (2Fe-2S) protein [Halorussus limi]|uniref:Rieske (2Fe-2S) protein n=1 Tax=Halorussus limi TaxID=2938695 RepID=A0A8U0HSA7_9EURY|nr:Rieske (2Fe-2S) protein [Halorussus limi]UPV73965.1 Rieske (2Fe-2S) protein [Halorussus limi]
MTGRTRLTTTETVRDERSWLFTVRDQYDELDEVILVPCEEREVGEATADSADRQAADSADSGVEAWVNRCTHEAQRLDRGFGAAMRDGQIICPKHGSMFDACSGYCDNGDAADTTLPAVEIAVEDGAVYLTDDGYEFVHEGSIEDGGAEGGENGAGDADESQDDDDDMPSSTSHIGF